MSKKKSKHFPMGCFDAGQWAKEFCKITGFKDESWALSWFASAIMTGHDEGMRRNDKIRDKQEKEKFNPDKIFYEQLKKMR